MAAFWATTAEWLLTVIVITSVLGTEVTRSPMTWVAWAPSCWLPMARIGPDPAWYSSLASAPASVDARPPRAGSAVFTLTSEVAVKTSGWSFERL